MTRRLIGLERSLSEDDYALIVSDQGRIKGVWIPSSADSDEIPLTIVKICVENFGLDPNFDMMVSQTIH